MRIPLFVAVAVLLLTGCPKDALPPVSEPQPMTAADAVVEVLPAADVTWEALNPARGDQSPRAATLWGDRKGTVATGFLVAFVDGFSSPPHVHNVTYRGVVLEGLVHNDDPDAATMWMPTGSYWTQPAGEIHITSAKGTQNVAYIEIEEGPYLVKPPAEAFDNGERPVNVDERNLVWLDGATSSWVDGARARVAHLWGSPTSGALNGTLVHVPAGAAVQLVTAGPSLRLVVIEGTVTHEVHAKTEPTELAPGSTVASEGVTVHGVRASSDDAVLYLRSVGPYRLTTP